MTRLRLGSLLRLPGRDRLEMMVLDLDSGAAAHLCRALEAYRRRLRSDGMALPEELRQLLGLLTTPASNGQHRTEMGVTPDGLQDGPMAQLFTVDEVADRLKVGERTVRRYTSTGRLATVKLGASPGPLRRPRRLHGFPALHRKGRIMSRVTNETEPSGSRWAVEQAERALADAAEGRKRTVDAERDLLEAREQIAANLMPAYTPGGSERRRPDVLAASYKFDQGMEDMLQQLHDDQRTFDQVYGPKGRTMVGMYERAKSAALGPEGDDTDAAA